MSAPGGIEEYFTVGSQLKYNDDERAGSGDAAAGQAGSDGHLAIQAGNGGHSVERTDSGGHLVGQAGSGGHLVGQAGSGGHLLGQAGSGGHLVGQAGSGGHLVGQAGSGGHLVGQAGSGGHLVGQAGSGGHLVGQAGSGGHLVGQAGSGGHLVGQAGSGGHLAIQASSDGHLAEHAGSGGHSVERASSGDHLTIQAGSDGHLAGQAGSGGHLVGQAVSGGHLVGQAGSGGHLVGQAGSGGHLVGQAGSGGHLVGQAGSGGHLAIQASSDGHLAEHAGSGGHSVERASSGDHLTIQAGSDGHLAGQAGSGGHLVGQAVSDGHLAIKAGISGHSVQRASSDGHLAIRSVGGRGQSPHAAATIALRPRGTSPDEDDVHKAYGDTDVRQGHPTGTARPPRRVEHPDPAPRTPAPPARWSPGPRGGHSAPTPRAPVPPVGWCPGARGDGMAERGERIPVVVTAVREDESRATDDRRHDFPPPDVLEAHLHARVSPGLRAGHNEAAGSPGDATPRGRYDVTGASRGRLDKGSARHIGVICMRRPSPEPASRRHDDQRGHGAEERCMDVDYRRLSPSSRSGATDSPLPGDTQTAVIDGRPVAPPGDQSPSASMDVDMRRGPPSERPPLSGRPPQSSATQAPAVDRPLASEARTSARVADPVAVFGVGCFSNDVDLRRPPAVHAAAREADITAVCKGQSPSVRGRTHAVTVTDVRVSDVTASNVRASNVTASDVRASDVTASDVTASDVTASDVIASDVIASDITASAQDEDLRVGRNISDLRLAASSLVGDGRDEQTGGDETMDTTEPVDVCLIGQQIRLIREQVEASQRTEPCWSPPRTPAESPLASPSPPDASRSDHGGDSEAMSAANRLLVQRLRCDFDSGVNVVLTSSDDDNDDDVDTMEREVLLPCVVLRPWHGHYT